MGEITLKESVMLRNRWAVIMVCLLGGVLFADLGNALESKFEGIGPLNVMVEELSADAVSAGFSKEELRTIVELKLRQSGIPITENIGPFVYINLGIIHINGTDIFVYDLEICLLSPVILIHNGAKTLARTWTTGGLGSEPKSSIKTVIKEKIESHLTKFCNEYLKANPKE